MSTINLYSRLTIITNNNIETINVKNTVGQAEPGTSDKAA